MNDSNPRAVVLGENDMSAQQTDTYGREPRQLRCPSKPSPAARDPMRVSLPQAAEYFTGYLNTALVCRTSSMQANNPTQPPPTESSVQLIQGCRKAFLPRLHATCVLEAYFTNLPVRKGKKN